MRLQFEKQEHTNKIAVLRAGAIGDFLVSTAALNALRCAYPSGEIVLLGSPWMKNFSVEKRTAIDRLVVVPVMKGIRTEKNIHEDRNELEDFFSSMQKEAFDLAISFHGDGTSASPFLHRLKAKFTVGVKSEDALPLDRSTPFYYYQNELLRYLEVVKLVGATTTELEPSINILQDDIEEASGILSFIDQPFVVIHPIASDIRRSWPAEKFSLLADALYEEGLIIVLSGASDDNAIVNEICNRMNNTFVNTSGKLSLGGLAALMNRAALVIG
jgi:ADP-heptose:LPS heptosyltransferase